MNSSVRARSSTSRADEDPEGDLGDDDRHPYPPGEIGQDRRPGGDEATIRMSTWVISMAPRAYWSAAPPAALQSPPSTRGNLEVRRMKAGLKDGRGRAQRRARDRRAVAMTTAAAGERGVGEAGRCSPSTVSQATAPTRPTSRSSRSGTRAARRAGRSCHAFHACRKENGGPRRSLQRRVEGYNCDEGKRDIVAGARYSAEVICKKGAKKVVQTYAQEHLSAAAQRVKSSSSRVEHGVGGEPAPAASDGGRRTRARSCPRRRSPSSRGSAARGEDRDEVDHPDLGEPWHGGDPHRLVDELRDLPGAALRGVITVSQ